MAVFKRYYDCLLYTSDAADDMQCVDLGGRRIIKKKYTQTARHAYHTSTADTHAEAWVHFFQAEDGIRDVERSRGLGDVYKRQIENCWNESMTVSKRYYGSI